MGKEHRPRSTPEIPFQSEIITPQLLKLFRDSGSAILQLQDEELQKTHKTGKDDFKTQGDDRVREIVRPALLQLLPNSLYVSEEAEDTHEIDIVAASQQQLVSVWDEIDGSTRYWQGSLESQREKRNPNWGISAGFVRNGEIVAGIIYQPATDTIFLAEKGRGAYMNGQKLSVSGTENIRDQEAQFIGSTPYTSDEKEYAAYQRYLARLKGVYGKDVELLGSQVIEAMQVAQGKKTAFIHFRTKPWDIAASQIIVTEAGGRCLSAEGDPYELFGTTILLTNGKFDIAPLTSMASEELRRTA